MAGFDAFRISSSGMSAERVRLDVIASNIANADSTRTPQGGPYVRKVVHFASVLGSMWNGTVKPNPSVSGVRVAAITNDPAPSKMVYDPGNPDADAQGYVATPNVEIVTEMTDMIAASRAYEANVTAFNAAKTMFQRALDISS